MKKFIILTLCLFFLSNANSQSYFSSTTTGLNNSKWMSKLSDDARFQDMGIPGTHNSGAVIGGDLVKCQTLSIPQQLIAGIRFLDIRCSYNNNGLYIYHGSIYQYLSLNAVLIHVINFLKKNPTETVFMRVKQEGHFLSNEVFASFFNSYLDKFGRSNFYSKNYFPANLGFARGKIVVTSKMPNILDSVSYSYFNLQDSYHIPTVFHIQSKVNLIAGTLIQSFFAGPGSTYTYLNYTSGSSGGAYPLAVAGQVNPQVFWYLWVLQNYSRPMFGLAKVKPGIIVMDFPGDTLIQQIIDLN